MFELAPKAKEALNVADVPTVARDFHTLLGGSVGDFPRFMINRNAYVSEISDVFRWLSPTDLGKLVRDPFSKANTERWDKIFVMDVDPHYLRSGLERTDRKITRLKGEQLVLDCLARRRERDSLADTARLFNACHMTSSPDGSASYVIASHTFKPLAIHFLAQGVKGDSLVLYQIDSMRKVESSTSQFMFERSQTFVSRPFHAAISVVRTVKRYPDLSLTEAYTEDDCKMMYVMQASDHSLFDAFFYDSAGGSVQLYILQTTIGQARSGDEMDFETVEHLVKRVGNAGHSPVKLIYVLVVPHTRLGSYCAPEVSWNMGSGFSKVEGDVCTQFLSIEELPSVSWFIRFIHATDGTLTFGIGVVLCQGWTPQLTDDARGVVGGPH